MDRSKILKKAREAKAQRKANFSLASLTGFFQRHSSEIPFVHCSNGVHDMFHGYSNQNFCSKSTQSDFVSTAISASMTELNAFLVFKKARNLCFGEYKRLAEQIKKQQRRNANMKQLQM